jgi:hypothetical protein
MESKLVVHIIYSLHTNHKYIDFISNPYHMSSSEGNFQNTRKWDGKDDVRTQHDWNINSWSRFVAPRAPISEEKSKIANEATTRWKRRMKKEGKRRKEEGQGQLGGPVTLNGLTWLSHAMAGNVTLAVWLRPLGSYCAMMESSCASVYGATPSWVTSLEMALALAWLKMTKFEKKSFDRFMSQILIKKVQIEKNQDARIGWLWLPISALNGRKIF